ncbi:hypothetical protein QCA50_010146 [Cerrena zonata]|uniref:Uncharacterized protein n=1 Tax=Cerrena zonata TaxID=2478898 RepID=A0AAW0G0J8_9APHY
MPRRPTAFEVSFPTEDAPPQSTSFAEREREEARASAAQAPPPPVSGRLKRAERDERDRQRRDSRGQNDKRPRRESIPKAYYQESVDEDEEREDYIVIGEDTAPNDEEDQKPIRVLSDFTIYDPKHGNQLISLWELENNSGKAHFRAAGLVRPVFVNEEMPDRRTMKNNRLKG